MVMLSLSTRSKDWCLGATVHFDKIIFHPYLIDTLSLFYIWFIYLDIVYVYLWLYTEIRSFRKFVALSQVF